MAGRDEMQSNYAARAPYYDDVYDKPERRADIAFLREYLPATFAGRTVLEVACGTGYWTQHIAPAASAMTATDAVAEPLELARGRPGVQCDFNNDGLPDIFYTDLITECFTLFVNRGSGLFFDETFPSRLGPLTVSHSGWSTRFLDWDSDGWKDILVAGSHVLDNVEMYSPRTYKETCFFYRNLRDGKFEDASKSLGSDFQVKGVHRGLAVGDFDNDGALEAAVSRLNDTCAFFRLTSGPARTGRDSTSMPYWSPPRRWAATCTRFCAPPMMVMRPWSA